MLLPARDWEYINRIASNLLVEVQRLKEFAERGDFSGVWVTSISINTLAGYLNNFVEEKRRQGWLR